MRIYTDVGVHLNACHLGRGHEGSHRMVSQRHLACPDVPRNEARQLRAAMAASRGKTRRRRGDNFGADVFPFYSKGTCNVKVLPTLSRKTLSGDDLTEAQRDHDFNGKPRNPTQKSGR